MLPDLDSATSTLKASTVDQENHSELLENTRLVHVLSCPVFTDQNGPFQSLSSPLPQGELLSVNLPGLAKVSEVSSFLIPTHTHHRWQEVGCTQYAVTSAPCTSQH